VTHAEDHRRRHGFDGRRHAGPGGPTEDPTKGFKYGGWQLPYFDREFGEELDRVFKEKFDHDLVDAMSLFTLPVVLGGGKKLFADGSAPHSFKLTGSRVSSTGVLIGHYERKIVDGALDSPSEREIARRERMKREA
jgi:hypothetical protein